MRRRDFLLFVAGIVLSTNGAAAQPASVPLVGVLNPGLPIKNSREPQGVELLRAGLQEHGYVDGRNIRIAARWSGGNNRLLAELAKELVALKPDVIVANGEPAIRAVKDATKSIPIVMSIIGDPIAAGFARSLSHPGGNLTGLTNLGQGLVGKRLELLLELMPKPGCVAALHNPQNQALDQAYLEEANEAAERLNVELRPVEASNASQLETAFADAGRHGCGAMLVGSDPVFTSLRGKLVALATERGFPAIYDTRWFVDDGGLISYGPDLNDMIRRAAVYVDKILKGAKPADLPIEQPTKFELVINLKTVGAIGLSVPQSLLARADEVIE